MRKLIYQVWITIDGFAADANNSTSFFDQSPGLSSGSDDDLLKDMNNFDTILLGANTYKMFVDYWPDAGDEQEVVANKLNSIPKVVFSKSLKKAPWGKWPEAQLINADAVEEIRKMKEADRKTMVLWGSISLAQTLMKADLIDEYHLRICPVALGDGRSLFAPGNKSDFNLFGFKQYPSGLVLLQYKTK